MVPAQLKLSQVVCSRACPTGGATEVKMVLGKRLRHTTNDVITPSLLLLLLQRSLLIVPCNCIVAEGGRVPRTRSGWRQWKLPPPDFDTFQNFKHQIACSSARRGRGRNIPIIRQHTPFQTKITTEFVFTARAMQALY